MKKITFTSKNGEAGFDIDMNGYDNEIEYLTDIAVIFGHELLSHGANKNTVMGLTERVLNILEPKQ